MTPEEFYRNGRYPEMKNEIDRMQNRFDYYSMIQFAFDYHQNEQKLNKHSISGKRPEWLDDETIHEVEQLWFTPNVNGNNPRTQAIRLIQSVAKKNGYEISIKKAYEIVQAACASGAVDTVAEGRECRQSVMCDVWNVTGYCSCCGGITLRGISDEGQP